MSVKLITSQTEWFAELPEVKAHLDESTTDNDAYIQELIYAAQSSVEEQCGAGLNLATYEIYYDWFPAEIEIWTWPVSSIESIKYTDIDGDVQTVSSDDYTTDLVNKPARAIPLSTWPGTKVIPNAVVVQYKTGFTSPQVIPADITLALLLIIDDWFKNREDRGRRFPRVSEKILFKYKYR